MKLDTNKPPKKSSENDASENKWEHKFELLSCPRNGKKCKTQLISINKNYNNSSYYYQNKDYQESIRELNNAFSKTFELNETTCSECAKMFRYTIVQSLESIHLELHYMSTGLLKKHDYKTSYILAENVLNDLKNKEE